MAAASLHIALTANHALNQAVTDCLTANSARLVEAIASYQVLEIVPTPIEMPLIDYDLAIFVSRQAVNCALENSQLVAELLPDDLFAIGTKTAEALQSHGYNKVFVPEVFNSEALLAMPQLQDVAGKQILLVKGEQGRELIANTLSERGAIITPVEVYRRQSCVVDLSHLATHKRQILALAPSMAAFEAFYLALKTAQLPLTDVHWVAVSERIEQQLINKQLSVSLAKSVAADDICRAILSEADTINAI